MSQTDITRCTPAYDAPAAFNASPVYHEGELAEAAFVQVPMDEINEINEIMAFDAGSGDTGQVVLISCRRSRPLAACA